MFKRLFLSKRRGEGAKKEKKKKETLNLGFWVVSSRAAKIWGIGQVIDSEVISIFLKHPACVTWETGILVRVWSRRYRYFQINIAILYTIF